MKLCHSKEDVLQFSNQFAIVLKPLREFGGKGLLKISGHSINDGQRDFDLHEYLEMLAPEIEQHGYLAMKYLKNVTQGDKRLVVVAGEILASTLRLPPEDSWLCNVAQGGIAVAAEADEQEIKIVKKIQPNLKKNGILMYGVDTLADDDGKRVLSEINALSIGRV